ncbi:MAG: hypothetical protein COT73_04340 [Bdellovibrio sp. CG10_big_fil_rev_8_21_14_0_10_47_8]|nr:MAG: hypothetical protein COT73_04340 [Bdellovibrio sp. CG10_big_fil_rev_8_21_14_0_10_47_8]
MSSTVKVMALLILSVSLFSCKKPIQDLDLTLHSTKAFAIPVDDRSCEDELVDPTIKSIKKISVKLGKVSVKWDGAYPLTINDISIRINSSYLTSEVSISIDGIDYAFNGTPGDVIVNAQSTLESTCSMRFGGLPIADESKSAFMTGTIKITGTTTDGDGVTTAHMAEDTFQIEYDGN